MVCENCKAEYQPKSRGRKSRFCCKACGDKYRYELNRKVNMRPKSQSVKKRPLYHKRCVGCNKEFDTHVKNTVYCSAACASRCRAEKMRAENTKICKWCGREYYTDHPKRRSYCSKGCYSEYRKASFSKKEVVRIQYNRTCDFCGDEFTTSIKVKKYCSAACCSDAGKLKKRMEWAESFVPSVFSCEWCGTEVETVMGNPRKQYCSNECQRLASKHRERVKRRMQMEEAYVENVLIRELYKRDEGICKLCGRPVHECVDSTDDWSATIDHIRPVSKGGEHSYANTQLAHRLCNSMKCNDETMKEIDWFEVMDDDVERWMPRLSTLCVGIG